MIFGFHHKDKETGEVTTGNTGYNRPPAPLPGQDLTQPPQDSNPPQQDSQPQQQFFSNDEENVMDIAAQAAAPPALFKRVRHAVEPQGTPSGENDAPIQTNNFYNNLTLGDQTNPVWTQPYSLWLTNDPGQMYGLAFNHTDAGQRVFGPEDKNLYFFNPPKIKSWVISGQGLGSETGLSLSNHAKLSVTSQFNFNGGSITVPLVQGMGFVTAIYSNTTPVLGSQVGIQEFQKVSNNKYRVKLFNQVVWSVYVSGDMELKLDNPNQVSGDRRGNATIQFARGDSEHYDECAGTYQTSVKLLGKVYGNTTEYGFDFNLAGNSRTNVGLVWLLPHHYASLVDNSNYTGLELDSTTKGVMRAYKRKTIVIKEQLPDINFEPWAVFKTSPSYSSNAINLMRQAAAVDVEADVVGEANINSMYTSGKILDKYAYIAYVCHNIIKDSNLTNKILPKVKAAIQMFASNKQIFPLVYDTTWKGLISSAAPGEDYGNSNYNDHHFHYGYHIHAIALVAQIDKDWLSANNNLVLNYAQTLIRDVASPNADQYFPQSRSFDWFHGHSWAHGIFASGDGKNEESSSEDYHCYYGIKLFARVIGDQSMEARANIVLAIMKRALNYYMLYSNDNKIQPQQFIGNKVSGILFENKIDYTTFFGRGSVGDEWIHGIHMLPITPISSFIRGPQFVKEEWDSKIGGIIDRVPDGWKGILMLNYALYDPKTSWRWFARGDWNPAQIDNGMSRTWSLAYVAGIGGEN